MHVLLGDCAARSTLLLTLVMLGPARAGNRASLGGDGADEHTTPAVTPAAASAGQTPVNLFKSFMADPPVVESIVFSDRLPPDPKQPWRMDLPLDSSQTFRYYEARWQPGAFMLRTVSGVTNLEEPRIPHMIMSHFGDYCWFHYGEGVRQRVLQLGSGEDNTVCRAAELNSGILSQVLTFGLLHTDAGSVRWTGNRFRVAGPRDDLQVSGELASSHAGTPETLTVTYAGDEGVTHWVIRYAYDHGSVGGGLPSTIRAFFIDKNREVERSEITVFSLKTATATLDRDRFLPDRIIRSAAWQLVLATNKAAYAVLPDGKLQMIRKLGDPPVRPSRKRESPPHIGAIYTAWAGANAAVFILAVRVINKQTSKKRMERKDL